MAFLQVHAAIVRDARAAWGGREVRHTGDGIMACFLSAVAAARCATQIQRALAQHEQENRALPVKVRIGAAAGEPVRIIWISLDRRFSLPRGSVPMLSRYPTWLPSCALERA